MRPLAQLLIYYFAIGKVLGAARSIPDFGLFVFIGLTGWTFFTEVVSKSTASIIENHGLVKKVYLPREIFPLSGAGSAVFTLAIQFVVLLAACAAFNRFPPIAGIGYVILGLTILVLVGVGVGLITAAVNVYLRDVEHIVEVLLIVFFWASPIVYSFAFVRQALGGGWLELLYLANPVTIAVMSMQRGLWVGGMNDPVAGASAENLLPMALISLAGAVVFLWLAQRLFARLQGNFAQEL
jgi:ABC-2 type transport system permease protein